MSSSNPIENAFLDILEAKNLRQIVNFSTAATGISDLTLTSKDVQIINLEKLSLNSDFTLLSNHFPLVLKFNVEHFNLTRRNASVKNIFSFCKGDYNQLSQMLLTNKFSSYCWSNPNKVLELWYKWLEDGLEACIPKRTIHRASLPPWVSQETSHLLKCLKTARKRYPESSCKVQSLIEKAEIAASRDKVEYEKRLAAGRSTTKILSISELSVKRNCLKESIM